ncbi:hypothetical protein ABG768_023248 [Culter alburnus]|uniref:Uncharacterized protein n=1 Tax=Culter alburnus TaxID=194366 RepID=A0AAW2AR17_CULAL
MIIEAIRSAILTEKSGKCVCIESKRKPSSSAGCQLVLDNHQGDSPKVMVYDISCSTSRNYMAFCFEHQGEAVFPVADGTKVNFEVVKKSSITQFMEDTFKEKFLFQWGKSGINDWRSLKSVAEPNMFLCVEKEKGKGKEKVTINSVEEPSFQIKTVETLFLRTQNSSGSAEARTRTLRNRCTTSKDLQASGIPSEFKYARIQCNWSPGSAKTRARYSTLINQRAAPKGKPRKNKMSMKI